MNEKINTIQKIGNWISAILLGNTRELIARIDERTLHIQEDVNDMRPRLRNLEIKVNEMAPKLDLLWEDKLALNQSPRQLNEFGIKVLNDSGMKQIIDEKKDALLSYVKAKAPENPYDAENVILLAVKELPLHYPDIVDRLKPGAFRAGADISMALFVGGIYLRNLIFPDLGFSMNADGRPSPTPP